MSGKIVEGRNCSHTMQYTKNPPLLEAGRRRSGGARPLVVGDRLDTDIAGAVGAGLPSLLVLTGVCLFRAERSEWVGAGRTVTVQQPGRQPDTADHP